MDLRTVGVILGLSTTIFLWIVKLKAS